MPVSDCVLTSGCTGASSAVFIRGGTGSTSSTDITAAFAAGTQASSVTIVFAGQASGNVTAGYKFRVFDGTVETDYNVTGSTASLTTYTIHFGSVRNIRTINMYGLCTNGGSCSRWNISNLLFN